jgi:small subunit ribosomal protein S2
MSIQIPEVKDILKTGLQFGHSRARWNPKMAQYIFTEKNGIHVVDVVKTRENLEAAVKFLTEVAKSQEVLFVGSKRQAADIVQAQAIRAGAHFVVNRWPGGLLTNFKMIKQSLAKLHGLEKAFEEGVQGRTKYEVMQMKSKWERLNRLYAGIKQMQNFPGAVIVIDPRFERVAVKEAKLMGIPVVALTDTNCDPEGIKYVIPGNDDALAAIETIVTTLADAVLAGNEGKGVKHNLIDYTATEVAIHRPVTTTVEVETEEAAPVEPATQESTPASQPKLKVSSSQFAKATGNKGILERVKEGQQTTKAPKAKKADAK